MWYIRDVLYAVLYVRVSCFVVRGCGVSRRYIDVCYCDILLLMCTLTICVASLQNSPLVGKFWFAFYCSIL